MTDLCVHLGPLKLRNPVLAASGFFGYGDEYAQFFDLAILGGFTTAPVGLTARDGAFAPRLVETPSGVLRSRDLGRMDVAQFVSGKLPLLLAARERGLCVIVHVEAEESADFPRILATLEASGGIDGYEVAVCCGPGGTAHLAAARAATERPIVARLPAAIPGIVDLAVAAMAAGADVLSLIEAVPGFDVNAAARTRSLGSPDGLLSGPAIRPIALRCVHEVSEVLDVPIIGMGGICTAADAVGFLLSGADAVAIASAVMSNPRAPVEVLDGIAEYCNRNAWERVADLTGSLRP